MKVLIIGGGIGGLTAASSLSRAGHEVTLAERTEVFSPIGAGIVLAPNAARLLEALDVDLASAGTPLRSMTVCDARGKPLQVLQNERYAAQWGPTFALSRPALSDALVAALPSSVERRLGHAFGSLTETADGVEVSFGEQRRTFDLLIGADGLHSAVRQRLMGDWPLRYSGMTCWRGVVKNPGFDGAVEAWGGAARAGVVPLKEGRLYYYLTLMAPRRAPALSWPEGFDAAFQHLRPAVPGLFEAMEGAPPLHHDLEELEEPTWGRGPVLLLGDAAHSMTPNQGQGAAMAIEDAFALPAALKDGAMGAIDRYRAVRHDRVRRMQLDSRRLGEVAHWQNPLGCALRNGLMQVLPAKWGALQFQRVVEPGLALLATSRPVA